MQSVQPSALGLPVATTPADEHPYMEPGLLGVLQMLVGIQLLLLVATVAAFPWSREVMLSLGGLTRGSALRQVVVEVSSAMQPVVLRILLTIPVVLLVFWPQLIARLGRWHLPLFAIYYAVAAAVSQAAFSVWALKFVADTATAPQQVALLLGVGGAWTLFVVLLFGVVIVAWQYSLRQVFWYLLFLAVAEVTALLPLLLHEAMPWAPLLFQVMIHVAIYAMVGFAITRMMAAQRAQRAALTEANVQLTQYAAAQEQLAVSHERNRMARELHDTLAHSLSAVAVQLEAVDSAMTTAPDEAHLILGKALAQTRSGLTETRRAMHALRATPLDDLGLALAIKNLAITTAQRNGLALQVEVPETQPNLSPAIEQGIYRIAQEALANVVHHARASRLAVALTYNGAVTLRVQDNGCGFDAGEVKGDHVGLQLMHERATMMQGTLTVTSAPGAGTTIKLVAL